MIVETSTGGVPRRVACEPEACAFDLLTSRPFGPSPNITGLLMAFSFDFDQSGQLVPPQTASRKLAASR